VALLQQFIAWAPYLPCTIVKPYGALAFVVSSMATSIGCINRLSPPQTPDT